jgi:hypothetical protein
VRVSSELVTPDRRLRSATSSSDLSHYKHFSASTRIKGAHRIRSPPPRIIALHVVALHGYSSSSCCQAALASALPRRRSLRDRPCQGTAVRDLVALRASRSRAATPPLRSRTSEPCASVARISLLLSHLKPPSPSLLAPGRSPPLESCSCPHTLTPPASVPCLLRSPNTCTHCQLPRDTARTLAPPARRRSRSLLHCQPCRS